MMGGHPRDILLLFPGRHGCDLVRGGFLAGAAGVLGFLGGGCVLGATKVTVLHGSTFDHLGF